MEFTFHLFIIIFIIDRIITVKPLNKHNIFLADDLRLRHLAEGCTKQLLGSANRTNVHRLTRSNAGETIHATI